MSLNDFETIPDPDDAVVSKIGSAVRAAMGAKEDLQRSIADAIDSSTNFGYELGAEDMKSKIISALEADGNDYAIQALATIDSVFRDS